VYDVHEFYDEKFGGGDVTADWIPRPLLATVRKAYGMMEAAVLSHAGGVVVVSDAMVDRYRRYVPDERIAVVQNYPNLSGDDVAQVRRSTPPMSEPYILHTGGASKNRAFEVMVEAAERLRETGVAAPIVNLGPVQLEGYSEKEQCVLKERARRARVILFGSVSHEETLRWLAHARIGYSPISDNENNRRGQPRKLFEYFLFGLPVVASDVGKIGSAVREPNAGIVVSPVDAGDHAAALAKLLGDSAFYAACAANAHAAAEGVSFRSQLPHLVDLYDRITHETPKTGVARAA
ncbi:MAG: glycosyltransferase, partial [Vulcanimicrobiaceae bacterium]